MVLSPEEKAANRIAFRAMNLPQKAEYIFAYYKLALVLALVAIVAMGSGARYLLTHKDPALYFACVNVVPDEDASTSLTTGFIEHLGESPRRTEVVCYPDLYLSSNADSQSHQYAYASKLKLLGSIDGEKLDVVIMNGEAYDLISGWGYLLDLSEACAASSADRSDVSGAIVSNVVVLSDNRVEVELGEADEYVAETIEVPNAIDVTGNPIFGAFAEGDSVYLGIIANSPRTEASLDYLEYVLEAE
jgi:hypothetical protein